MAENNGMTTKELILMVIEGQQEIKQSFLVIWA
jgi:hypothetical protein